MEHFRNDVPSGHFILNMELKRELYPFTYQEPIRVLIENSEDLIVLFIVWHDVMKSF